MWSWIYYDAVIMFERYKIIFILLVFLHRFTQIVLYLTLYSVHLTKHVTTIVATNGHNVGSAGAQTALPPRLSQLALQTSFLPSLTPTVKWQSDKTYQDREDSLCLQCQSTDAASEWCTGRRASVGVCADVSQVCC